jgi:hypothetical protein
MAVTVEASGTWTDLKGSTFTVTIASPGVFTLNNHGLVAGDAIVFQTTGALPTGLSAATTYYVISAGLTTNAFEVSTTVGGSAVNTSGTQSGVHSVTSVEHILRDTNTAGVFQLEVDLANLAASDTVELRQYGIILTGGTRRLADPGTKSWSNAQTDPNPIVVRLDPIGNDLTDAGSLRFTLKQTAGTGRAFPWKVLRVV